MREAEIEFESPFEPAAARCSSSSGRGDAVWKINSALGRRRVDAVQRSLRHAPVLGQHLARRVSRPVGDERGIPFREMSVIEHEQKLAPVRREPLDRMRIPGREKPQVVLFDIFTKARPSSSSAVIRAFPLSMIAHSAAWCQCSSRIPPATRRMFTPAISLEIGKSSIVT